MLAPRGPSPGLSALYAALGVLLVAEERYTEYLMLADRAVAMARGLDDPEMLAEAEVKRGHAMICMVGRVEEGMRSTEIAIRLGEAAGADMTNLGGWYSMLAGAHLTRGEVAISRRLNARGRAIAERQGNLLRLLTTAVGRAEIAFAAGEWDTAHADYVWIRDTSRQMQMPFRLIQAQVGLGRLLLARGDWHVASHALEEAESCAVETNYIAYLRMVSLALAERDILTGRPAAALVRLAPLHARSDPQERYIDDLPDLAGLGQGGSWATRRGRCPDRASNRLHPRRQPPSHAG